MGTIKKKKKIKDVSALSKMFLAYDQELGKDVPVVFKGGQKEIFNIIAQRAYPRNHIMTVTQYGKSFSVAAGVVTRVMTHPEKWAIIAPSQPKAMIIMRYIIEFCNKNHVFKTQLDMEEGKKNRLMREISKKRIIFKNGAEVFVLSADAQNKQAAGEALMGFGSPNIILDESSLIDDDIYAKIFRMLGGHKDNFILEIGNPFRRNHFLESFHNDKYHKVVIDWRQAIKEGRLQESFIDEMRDKAFFDVLYECKFPKEDDVDADGWSILLSEFDVTNAFRDSDPNAFGDKRLGVDVARSGGNYNVWVLRTANYAEVLAKTTTDNLMDVIGTTKDLAQKHGITNNNIFLDATGLGAGVYDRFVETGWTVTGINMSEAAIEKDKFINIRAEAYMRLREWIKKGGTLERNTDFLQLTKIKYKLRSNGKIKIIDKETLRKNGIPSPDVADALMLTFGRSDGKLSLMGGIRVERNIRKQPTYE